MTNGEVAQLAEHRLFSAGGCRCKSCPPHRSSSNPLDRIDRSSELMRLVVKVKRSKCVCSSAKERRAAEVRRSLVQVQLHAPRVTDCLGRCESSDRLMVKTPAGRREMEVRIFEGESNFLSCMNVAFAFSKLKTRRNTQVTAAVTLVEARYQRLVHVDPDLDIVMNAMSISAQQTDW